jgi:hypothetical protein
MPRGGKRPNSGRPKGSIDRATAEAKGTIEELARSHTETAINALVHVAMKSESDAARVSAASVILDRGYGKARQSVDANVSGGLNVTISSADAALL